MSDSFRKITENAKLYGLTNPRTHKKKKPKKASKVRTKSDSYNYYQYGIYLKLNKIFSNRVEITRDVRRCNQWWDYSIKKYKILIKIMGKTSNPNIDVVTERGWRVLTINWYDPEQASYNKLVSDIEFMLSKPKFIAEREQELNKNLPKSEQWLLDKMGQEWFWGRMKFEQNKPMFGQYIYDLFSSKYRLCIEVDGSVHEKPEQIEKDLKKNFYTISKGFHIIRIKAFDNESYDSAITLINQLIENFKAKKYSVEKQKTFNDAITELNKSGKLGF